MAYEDARTPDASLRLLGLVTDAVQRSFLAGLDGFWAEAVLRDFAFLESRGGRVATVRFHQAGDYIEYIGPWGLLVLEFAPDTPLIGGELRDANGVLIGTLDDLARERCADAPLPALLPLDRSTIAENISYWARCLELALPNQQST